MLRNKEISKLRSDQQSDLKSKKMQNLRGISLALFQIIARSKKVLVSLRATDDRIGILWQRIGRSESTE